MMLSMMARQIRRNEVAVNCSLFTGQNTIADTVLPAQQWANISCGNRSKLTDFGDSHLDV